MCSWYLTRMIWRVYISNDAMDTVRCARTIPPLQARIPSLETQTRVSHESQNHTRRQQSYLPRRVPDHLSNFIHVRTRITTSLQRHS